MPETAGAVKASLESLEGAWNNYQVYLNDEINFIDEDAFLNLSASGGDGEKAAAAERRNL